MPKKKTRAVKRKTTRISRPRVTSSQGPTYDTLMIVTILLLLFVYPIGLIAMWWWMKTWPVWLRIVISLPFIISVVFLIIVVGLLGSVVRRNVVRARYEEQRVIQMQQQQGKVMQITATPTPTFTY